MENCYLQSSTITTIPSSSLLPNKPFIGKTSVHGHSLKFPNFSKSQNPRKLNILHLKATASVDQGKNMGFPFLEWHCSNSVEFKLARGATGVSRFSSQAVEASVKEVDAKDESIAFVAGATGKVGSRTVRELLKLGFRVRAGVRSAQRAGSLVQSVKQMKVDVEGVQPVEKLEIVECDLEKPGQIGAALGDASVVLCCIGASEKEVFDITGPYRIDYMATKNLVDAATAAKVKHFIMVSSLGTNKFGLPAAVLNLFWGVLCWKRKAEEALEVSGVPYTIVRPGGMERPTDAYKETHNITLSEEDTLFGGQVSNLQVAELIAFMAQNRSLSYCKVVEVIAETTAPLTPLDKLLARIPSKRVESKEPAEDPPKNVVPVPTIPPKEKEPEQGKVTGSRPLSPYSAYEDWKPPTTPTPTQPIEKKEAIEPTEVVFTFDIEAPAPAPAGAKIESPAPAPAEAKIESPLSPYSAYDDLKPPTSPTPSKPMGSAILTFVNGGPETSNNEPSSTPNNEQQHVEANLSPLSPYTMYEDLKPPTTPTPSSP